MDKTLEKHALNFVLVAIIILQTVFLFLNTRTFGGADNNTHYQIAKYAFKYPELFLDLWGKPVFTTLLAPFTVLGFKFAKIFNLLIALITLLLTSKLTKKLFGGGAVFTVILVAFSPAYFMLSLSHLTEVLFSLVLVLSVYFFYQNRFWLSALVLSFIPFVRTEGIILLPVFAVALILKRSYRSVLFLAAGTLFYTIVGYFVFGDILWLLHKMPYSMGESVYGSGSLFHFIENRNDIFGLPLIILLIPGIIYWIYEVLKKFSFKDENLVLFIIVVGSWAGYFAAHSYVWWKGTGGSLGLIRVMGGIVPLAVITAMKSFHFLTIKLKNKIFPYLVLVIISLLQIFWFFKENRLPLKSDSISNLIVKSSNYLKETGVTDKVYYFNPEIAFHLGLDPYNKEKNIWGVGDKMKPSNSMDFGDILVWDAHFGPNEGRVPYEAVENDEYLQKVKTFLPVEKITVLGGHDYAIHIYKKVKTQSGSSFSDVVTKSLDFNLAGSNQVKSIDGFNVFEMNEAIEFSPNIVVYAEELVQKDIFGAEVQVSYKGGNLINDKEVLLVLSVENGKENLLYKTVQLTLNDDDKHWKTETLTTRFPADIPKSSVVKIYIWNKEGKKLFINNLQAEITSY
ncbi:MAG: hypothetical protein ABFS16_01855 [Bacteroidota bacterium]